MCNSNFTNLLWFIVTSEILPLMYTIHLQMYIHKNLQKCQCPHTHLKFIWSHGILYNFIYSSETIHIICWMVSTTRPAILHHHSDTSTFPHTHTHTSEGIVQVLIVVLPRQIHIDESTLHRAEPIKVIQTWMKFIKNWSNLLLVQTKECLTNKNYTATRWQKYAQTHAHTYTCMLQMLWCCSIRV